MRHRWRIQWAARLLLVLWIPFSGSGVYARVPPQSVAPARVAPAAWAETDGGAAADLLVVLAPPAHVSTALDACLDRETRGRWVTRRLWETAQSSQAPLRAWLDAQGVRYRAFYIVNALLVHADRRVLLALAARPEVARVLTNPAVRAALPLPSDATPDSERATAAPQTVAALQTVATSQTVAAAAIPWGVLRIRAPEVWALGYRGEGVVVAGQDTGYDWTHPALEQQYRGWDGTVADHDYNWHDAIHVAGGSCPPDSPVPCDDYGHGTHTMGTIVGDDGADNQVGVAPGAQWIGCRNMLQGVGTPASYIECFEFFLAPYPVGGDPSQGDPALAPDVINNSWSCPPQEGCDADHVALLQSAVDSVRAAGIVVVTSAGNAGPACGTVATPPGMFDSSYTIGATTSDADDLIASFSSRGTTTGLIKPDLSAPGASVYSAWPGGGYTTLSGTSMAAPHVAGALALIGSARPDLLGQPEALEQLLSATAVARTSTQCGDAAGAVPNNVYGWGRLDALAAVSRALTAGMLTGSVADSGGQPLTPALVMAESPTGEAWSTVTTPQGSYTLMLASGRYTVTASLAGYASAVYPGVQIAAGLTTTLATTLTLASPTTSLYFPLVLQADSTLP